MLVIGHKGASVIAPENTLKAFKKAIELKADYIEFDIHKTSDDEIVIIHDANTLNATGISGEIRDMKLNDIKSLDAGEGEQIPTLKELISIAKNKIGLQVEVKASGLEKQLVKLLEENKLIDNAIISSFALQELLKIQELEPKIKIGYLIPSEITKFRLASRYIKKAKEHRFYAVHPYYKTANQEFVDLAHKNSLKINVWTVNEEKIMRKLVQLGVDGIITDDIALLNKILKRQ